MGCRTGNGGAAVRYITKAELAKQLRRVKKRYPEASYAELLKINRQEQLQPVISAAAAIKTGNKELHRIGLGVNRGMYMESPIGVVDGKMRYRWGKLISYSGIGQESGSGMHFDGEGGFSEGKARADGLLTAIHYAEKHDLFERFHIEQRAGTGSLTWPAGSTFRLSGDLKTCVVCKSPFVGRSHAKTCRSKCRKALSRAAKKSTGDVTLSPNT